MSEWECYGVRRWSPFRGVMHVVRGARGRAVTVDGVHWQLQLWRERRPPRVGAFSEPAPVVWGYLVVGVWSKLDGLARFPVDPAFDIEEIQSALSDLVDGVERHSDAVPFEVCDRYELWAIDEQSAPVALLVSARDQQSVAGHPPAPFVATKPKDLGFVSATLNRHPDLVRSLAKGSRHHRDALAAAVRTASVRSAWICRRHDDSGMLTPGGLVARCGRPRAFRNSWCATGGPMRRLPPWCVSTTSGWRRSCS